MCRIKCKKCNIEMKPGVAMQQTYRGIPDFIGGEVMTVSPGGPGKLVTCLKCPECGYSVTATNDITDDNITSLKEGEIFVFGSNESGRHGKGAAKTAMKWGAIYGQAEGLQGRTYGIPTVNASISNNLKPTKIKLYVDRFIVFAKEHPELKFLVTQIGCGLAGMSHKQIAPLFKDAVGIPNISLPRKFIRILS